MKKTIVTFLSIILVLTCILSLSSCAFLEEDTSTESPTTSSSSSNSSSSNSNSNTSNKTNNSGNTNNSNTSTTNNTTWEIGEFVDEFNKPTGEKYLSTTVTTGSFSNSATTNSKLTAIVQVTSDSVAIMLWEYSSQLVKGTFDTNEYSITVLDSSGTKHYFDGVMYKGNTRIYLSNSDEAAFLSLLKKSGTISIYLKNSKYTVSTYLFDVETAGFSTLYSQLK